MTALELKAWFDGC